MKYAKCEFCGETFDKVITKTKRVCYECSVIESYDPSDPYQYFKAVNHITGLILKKRFNMQYSDPYHYLDTWGSAEGRKGFDVIAKGVADLRKKELRTSKALIAVKDILPSKEICEGFRNLSTHKSVGDALAMLCRYYHIPIMKTIFYEVQPSDKICKNAMGVYYPSELTAYFDKSGFSQTTILHEFYHHLVNVGIASQASEEEDEVAAEEYAKQFTDIALREAD